MILEGIINNPLLDFLMWQGIDEVTSQSQEKGYRQIDSRLFDEHIDTTVAGWSLCERKVEDRGLQHRNTRLEIHPCRFSWGLNYPAALKSFIIRAKTQHSLLFFINSFSTQTFL